MNKNDIYTAEITDLTNIGSGVCRIDGRVVFVPLTAIGDKCSVKILKVKDSYAYGKIEEILTPSPDRIPSDCPAFGKCGGCSFRHLTYEAELAAKERFIKDAFTRTAGLTPDFLPIIANDALTRYRNKAQYPIGKDKNGQAVCGFYASNSHRIIPCDDCLLQPEIFSEITDHILQYIRTNKLSVYNEEENKGVLRHICLRKGHHSGEINVTIVARRNIPELKKLSKDLMTKFPAIKGVVLNLNKKDTNVIMGEEELTLAGEPTIKDIMCENTVTISPGSFYQVNTPMAERLYAAAKDFAQPENKTVADIYCGIGTIGLSLANEAKHLIGIEIVDSAIQNAKLNAVQNNITNAEFYCSDAHNAAEIIKRSGLTPEVLILDPARKGCHSSVLQTLAALSPERIVMISCNPVTAARDCAELEALGYKTVKVQGVDLFSRTNHVECVSLIIKS
ncbi:MAG: 23S rRNA (uracil(1939)-C(5))-methyltransferase RlmD [Oscillospiraceae bacterium]|nr:23S rRNA (uracil(1939)-C(5))-methyltransferase RlmD [Oscillospiraceae bacterium]